MTAKKVGELATAGKHMRLPLWLITGVEDEGAREARTFSIQITHDLESLPKYRKLKQAALKAAKQAAKAVKK